MASQGVAAPPVAAPPAAESTEKKESPKKKKEKREIRMPFDKKYEPLKKKLATLNARELSTVLFSNQWLFPRFLNRIGSFTLNNWRLKWTQTPYDESSIAEQICYMAKVNGILDITLFHKMYDNYLVIQRTSMGKVIFAYPDWRWLVTIFLLLRRIISGPKMLGVTCEDQKKKSRAQNAFRNNFSIPKVKELKLSEKRD